MFRLGNASVPAVLFKLRLPHALPHIFVGLKIAAGASVVGALVGETFAGSSALGAGGLGYASVYALSQLDTPYLFALILTSSLLGLALFAAVTLLEQTSAGIHDPPGRRLVSRGPQGRDEAILYRHPASR